MIELRLREVQLLVQDHTAQEVLESELEPTSVTLKFTLLNITLDILQHCPIL